MFVFNKTVSNDYTWYNIYRAWFVCRYKNMNLLCMITKCLMYEKVKRKLSLPGIEPGTLSVLDSCDNHYTTETPE